jgi:F-type H+-transporting ATPase subunit b
MLFSPFQLAEEGGTFVPTVHPFWVLVSIVNFLLLLYFMRRLLWGPVMAMLEDRARRIREGLETAEAAKQERERMQQESARLIAEARREAAEIAERMSRAAEAAATEIRNEARAESERIRLRAQADVQRLQQQAMAELRGEVAALAVYAASRVLEREVDADTHRALVERSLDEAGGELTRV